MLACLCTGSEDDGCKGEEGNSVDNVFHRMLDMVFLIIVLVCSEIKSGRNKDSRLIFAVNYVLIRPR